MKIKPFNIKFNGIVVIVGTFGSGKSEVAINLALIQKQMGITVKIADLDLVNPYFRCREARQALARQGVESILPPESLLQADLPILIPQVASLIRQPAATELAILDVGGDGAGATVLAALADAFADCNRPVQMLQVVNPFQPKTQTEADCLKILTVIEAVTHMKVNGWVGNAHLMEDTTTEDIAYGHVFMQSLACNSGLPLMFIAVEHEQALQIALTDLNCPVLPIYRQLVPPWQKPIFN